MPRPLSKEDAPKRVTVREIAAAAGVSAMTVSRALRDSPRVTLPLRKRVRKIAAKLGYRPDPEVTKLMIHLRRRDKAQLVASIAAITSLPADIESPQMIKMYKSARLRAEAMGYRLELFRVAEPHLFNRQLERTLFNRGIEGVLLLQMQTPAAMDGFLGWEKFSAVAASPSVLSPDFPRVGANHFHNARLICERLASRGCKRIGFAGSVTFGVRTNEAFVAASACQCLAAAEKPVRPLVFRNSEEARLTFLPWLERQRPDAVIVHAEALLPALIERLKEYSGGPVLLTCTSVESSAPLCPGIDERHELIGRKAVDVVSGMLNRNEKNLRTTYASTLIDGQWIEPATKTRRKVG